MVSTLDSESSDPSSVLLYSELLVLSLDKVN